MQRSSKVPKKASKHCSRCRYRIRVAIVVLFVAFGTFAATSHAGDYTVGNPAGGTNNYDSLEELRQAVTLADGDSITLHVDDDSLTENLDFSTLNNATLTIKSSDGTPRIIETSQTGSENGGILNINTAGNAATLNLDGVRFQGGTIEVPGDFSYGGAIFAKGKLSLNSASQVEFSNNLAQGDTDNSAGHGGAIYVDEMLTLGNGSFLFTDNSAQGGGGNDSGQGGAIFAVGDISITNGNYLFSGNTAMGNGGDDSGLGGAIHTLQTLSLTNGNYEFTNNTASGEAGTSSGWGGAIRATQLEIADGTCVFSQNSAIGGNDSGSGQGGAIRGNYIDFVNGAFTFSQNSVTGGAGSGGAISSGTLTITDGVYTFSENYASTTDSFSGNGGAIDSYTTTIANGTYHFLNNTVSVENGMGYGYGGAVWSINLGILDGEYVFFRNTAIGGNNDNSGYGGAIYGCPDIKGGSYLFSENSAIAGNASSSGHGGAIYCPQFFIRLGYSMLHENATTVFSRNIAQGGTGAQSGHGGAVYIEVHYELISGNITYVDNSATGGSGDFSGWGGAVFVEHLIMYGQGSYNFINNLALGKSGRFSGLGGALFIAGDSNITNMTFLNNRALTDNVNDPTSGRGGAIFIDGDTSTGHFDFSLHTTTGNPILFQGNMHGHVDNPTPNGIYFGTTSPNSGNIYINAMFDAVGHFDPIHDFNLDSGILMYDPIESQGAISGYYDVDLTLYKTGEGLWLLGGDSQLNSAATMSIDEGHFWLYRGASLNLNNATTADLTVKNGAWFHPTIQNENSVSTIVTGIFNAENGARMKTVGISTLMPGDHTFADAIVVADSAGSNIASSFVYDPVGGTMFDEAKYVYNSATDNYDLVVTDVKNMSDELGADPFWDVYRKQVLPDEERAIFDWIYEWGVLRGLPDLGGLKGKDVVDLTNLKRTDAMIFRNLLLDRMGGCPCSVISCDRELWGTVTHTWADLDGITYRPTAFTFGADRRIGQWHLGIAGQYLNGNIRNGDTTVTRGKSQNMAFGLYGGKFGRDGYGKGILQFAGGWNDVDTYYTKSNDHTWGNFDSATLGASIEFGRTFRFGDGLHSLTITPHAGADYIFINGESFDERGGNFRRSFGSTNDNVAELPLGLRLTKTFAFAGDKANWICPNVDLVYVRSVGDNAPSATVGYLTDASLSWRTTGTALGRDVFRMNLGLDGKFFNRIDTRLSYQLETRDRYDSHQLNATLAWCR